MTILAAALTFIGVAAYVNSVSSQVGPMTRVVRLTTDVAAMHPIAQSDNEVVEVPVRWTPAGAVTSFGQIEGLVTVGSYQSGEVLQTGMLTEPPGLQAGYREVAIMVDAETGVAGRISTGDYVDIIATVTNESTGEEDESGAFAQSQQIPVTFALSTDDSLKVAYAESFAVKLRLALRGTGDTAALTDDQSTYHGTGNGGGRR